VKRKKGNQRSQNSEDRKQEKEEKVWNQKFNNRNVRTHYSITPVLQNLNGYLISHITAPYKIIVKKHFPVIEYAVLFLTLLLHSPSLPQTAAADSQWGPWDRDRIYEKTTLPSPPSQKRPALVHQLTTYPAHLLITFFQKVISPVDGPTCDFYPTCSAYALQALKKHGLFLGLTMANERANRNHAPDGYELISRFGRYYLYDPVENNDFWFVNPGKNEAP